ncbi:AAA family ATPase [Protofrankia symbiont of Coriaria ruscifolia]|uniref:Uncharacterized protein n=1 Tax=Candidatus Protofrankia californiensis TaxID=1839754 RepID=A0A1C3PH76_9ACTN|nr:AAA family ATPase [Protofrankia symbiont of Coriaria ruscifolia]SBW29191.1 hypothetical protein FDG2_6575 [Candidatus Protofrankia californiensis]
MSGLPATGKTTISRTLARAVDGVHLRIDTIEQAVVDWDAGTQPLGPVGYGIGYARSPRARPPNHRTVGVRGARPPGRHYDPRQS